METKDILRQRRKTLGLTQEEVASFVGVSRSCYSRWETGDIANMGIDKIERLSKILLVSPIELLFGSKNQSNDSFSNFIEDSNFSEEELQELMEYGRFIISKRNK